MAKNFSNKSAKTNDGDGASYSRYSSEHQNETSISDQQREIAKEADRDGVFIPDENAFSDSAVSGAVRARQGLDALLTAAKQGRFKVLYFFSLSRLARESVISLPIIKTLAINYRVRVISIRDGFDTANPGWEFQAAVLCAVHEKFLRDLSDNVKKGLVGTIEDDFSVGDYCFGYHSVPSPNNEMTRRGGIMVPRRVTAINEKQAEVVRQVFYLFVCLLWSIGRIAKMLTRVKAPKDHRSTTDEWYPQLVVSLLRNRKYIGDWTWGKTERERDPNTGKVAQVPRDEAEYSEWSKDRPALRIIDDVTFYAAQKRLDEQAAQQQKFRGKKGWLKGSNGSQAQRHLLSRLFKCAGCGKTFHVAGANGEYLQCSGTKSGKCKLTNMLPWDLAAQKLLKVISDRFLMNQEWVRSIHQRTVKVWTQLKAQRPDNAEELRSRIKECDRQILRLVNEIEASDEPDPALSQRLKERRRERKDLERQLAMIEDNEGSLAVEPTIEWVAEQLSKLHETLTADSPSANEKLLNLLGGPITLELMSVEDRKRKYWRGTVSVKSLQFEQLSVSLADKLPSNEIAAPDGIGVEFREPSVTDLQVDKCWELLQTGLSFKQMSVSLGVNKTRITAIMKQVAKKFGDGLSPKELKAKFSDQRAPSEPYRQFIEPAMKLFDQDLLYDEIADRLGTHRNAISEAIAAWHIERGLPVPDGRTRRKSLQVKERPRKNQEPDSPRDEDSIAGKAA